MLDGSEDEESQVSTKLRCESIYPGPLTPMTIPCAPAFTAAETSLSMTYT